MYVCMCVQCYQSALISSSKVSDATKLRPKAEFCFGKQAILSPSFSEDAVCRRKGDQGTC